MTTIIECFKAFGCLKAGEAGGLTFVTPANELFQRVEAIGENKEDYFIDFYAFCDKKAHPCPGE